MTTITLTTPEPLVRLKSSANSDEINVGLKSYRAGRWGAFFVPREHLPPLTSVGGFHESPITMSEALSDVASAIEAIPEGKERAALSAALVSIFPDA
jgi:hypothetical protein